MNYHLQKIIKASYLISRPLSGLLLHNSRRSRIIVINDDSILLVRGSFGHQLWSLPGGGLHRGESDAVGAARELKEETGLDLPARAFQKLGEKRLKISGSWAIQNLVFFNTELQMPTTLKPRPLEIIEAKWFKLESLPKNHSPTLDAGLLFLKKPMV